MNRAAVSKNTGLYKIIPIIYTSGIDNHLSLRYSYPTEAMTRQATKGKNMTPLTEFDTMSDAGWITITEFGEENIYFTFEVNGEIKKGYCKAL